jgi:TolB-like protein/Flp pilus assembly protein TadD
MPMIVGTAIIIVLFAIALKFLPEEQAQPSSKQIRLVVLPFENLGVGDENFADVVTEDVTLCLEDIQELDIISRRSSMQYKDRGKSTRQIGEELQVDYILEGTVKREQSSDPNDQWTTRLHLIRVSDDTQVWGQTYVVDMRSPIQEQSNVVKEVAQALDITVLEADRLALASRPTEDMEAYEYYLQGNDYFYSSYDMNDLEMAIAMYNNAVKLDRTFTLAYCRLSMAHAYTYFFYPDFKKEHISMAWEAARKAEELDPHLPETHHALGRYYYLCHLDYNRALKHLTTALGSQPTNSGVLSFIGFIKRRQANFDGALVYIKKAYENDPRNYILATEVAATLARVGRYAEALRYLKGAVMLAPDETRAYNRMAELYLHWEGKTENAWNVLNDAKQNNKTLENGFTVTEINLNVYDGNYKEALDILLSDPEPLEGRSLFVPYPLRLAQIYRYMGNDRKAKECYEESEEILKLKIDEDPDDARFHSSLGIAYAGLGYKGQAIVEGKEGVRLFPVKKDVWVGKERIYDLGLIYVMVGEYDDAVSQLHLLLSFPGNVSVSYLRNHPDWKSLHDHTGFKQLLDAGK